MNKFCMNCGAELPESASFCPKCGTKIEIPCCPSCGKQVDFGTDFCIYCGQPLRESKEEGPAVPSRPKAKLQPEHTSPKDQAVEKTSIPPIQNASENGAANPKESNDVIQDFSWTYKAALGRIETTVNTVTVEIANDVIHILETQGSALGKKEPTRLPEKEILLSGIEHVRVSSHWSALFGVPLLLCVPLLLYGWLVSRIDWITAVLCLALVAVVAFRYSFQIHHQRLIIIDHDKNKIVLRGKDRAVLQQVEEAIINRTGLTPPVRKKRRPALKLIGVILAFFVLIFAAICAFEEIYLRRMFPKQIMLNPDVIAYAQAEISYRLAPENYDIAVEITGGNLEKRTALPKYEDDTFTYFFVDYVYEITISDGTESVSGTVTIDASFEVNPFHSRPNDILFNTFTYSDNLTDFAKELTPAPEMITAEEMIGRWELQYLKMGETVLYDTTQQNIYFQFFEDYTSEMVSGVTGDAVYSTWEISENRVIITESSGLKSVGIIQDNLLCFEDSSTAMRFEKASGEPSRIQSIGAFDDIVGAWQDTEGYGSYLFIGYSDSSKEHAYAYFASAQEFEVELVAGEGGETFSGTVMGYGSEPIYAVEICPYKYWLEVSVYIPDSEDDINYIQFVPADPDACPYENPYFIG